MENSIEDNVEIKEVKAENLRFSAPFPSTGGGRGAVAPCKAKVKKPRTEAQLVNLKKAQDARRAQLKLKKIQKDEEQEALNKELEDYKKKMIEKKKKQLETKAKKELMIKMKEELKLKQELENEGINDSDFDEESDEEIEAPIVKPKAKPKKKEPKPPVIINNYIHEKPKEEIKKPGPPRPTFLFV